MYAYSRIQLRNSFDRKVILIWLAIVFDAVATVWLMCQGFGEVNPALQWVADNCGIPGLAIAKIAWSMILLSWLITRKQFNKYVDHLIIAYFVLYTGGWWAQFVWEAIRWTQ